MRIYAVADIHGRENIIDKMERTRETINPDILVVAGDTSGYGRDDVILSRLNALPLPTLVIPGNIDSSAMEHVMASLGNLSWIHERETVHRDVSFVGLGGSLTFPSLAWLGQAKHGAFQVLEPLVRRETIFVTHCPPWGILDRGFFNRHGGSKELKKFIEERQPKVHICGHIHENSGVERLGETLVVNCSLGQSGAGAVIDLGADGTVQAQMLA